MCILTGKPKNKPTARTFHGGWCLSRSGNFGPWLGPLYLGLALGAFFGWVETSTARLSLFSLPVILACFLMISLTAVSGMVTSVWVASLFQMGIVIVISLSPFLRRIAVAK